MAASNAVLLPGSVRPRAYRIALRPDLSAWAFRGEVTVEVEVLEATPTVVLNAYRLEIASAEARAAGRGPMAASGIALDQGSETAAISFPEPLSPGEWELRLAFSGAIGDTLTGFYRSQYTGPDGATRYLASTQFEPAHARAAFPCWDEPALKATFQLTMVVPEGMDAISNTPVEGERPVGDGRREVRFSPTPVMSTYLLAFLVGEMGHVEGRSPSGTLVRVFAPRGAERHGRFALETSLRLLDYFNGYFGIPYPLEKLDHVAIPDFAAGAMENWGMITYRETALLVDPQNSASATRQRVAEVIAHEMAHMWFGDLVTMAWWNDLWLNESFASWMGDKAVDHLFPDWEMWTQFVGMDTMRALALDGLRNSHPIEAEVRHPAEVEQLFDAISYSKGGSLLRMLEQFLGPETFRQGLRRYLSAHQYGNARTDDLWEAMEAVSGQPVRSIMATWTGQMGYPVLHVQPRRQGSGTSLALRQTRFLYSHLMEDGPEDESLWSVPVGVATSWSPEPATTLLTGRSAAIALPTPGAPAGSGPPWFKVNPGQTGFYRVHLPPEEWPALGEAVAAGALPPTDRLGLQSDAHALARAGYLPATEFLRLAGSYRGERDASVWRDLAANLGDLDLLLAPEPFYPRFREYARGLVRPVAQDVGWEPGPDEGHLRTLLRSLALGQAGYYGDAETLATGAERFARYLVEPTSLPPDLRGVVYGIAAMGGDASTYQQLWDLERQAALQEEKVRLLAAMARLPRRELLEDLLARSLGPQVRAQDTVMLVMAVAANPAGRGAAWEFVKDAWAELDRRYGRGGFALMRLVGIAGGFTTHALLEDVERFFHAHPVPAADRTVRQSLEQIRLNIRWLELNLPLLARWLGG